MEKQKTKILIAAITAGLIILTGVFYLANNGPKQEAASETKEIKEATESAQTAKPGVKVKPSDLTYIEVFLNDEKVASYSMKELKEMSKPLDSAPKRLKDQVIVNIAQLLNKLNIKSAEKIQFVSYEGQQTELPYSEVIKSLPSIDLISTFVPSWKLVKITDLKKPPKGFLLRSVGKIKVYSSNVTPKTSTEEEVSLNGCPSGSKVYTILEEALTESSNVCTLNLANKDLTAFPVDILKLLNLKNLYLGHNKLSKIPVEVSKLTKLISLNLDSNEFTKFPIEVSGLTNLETLKIGRNQLTEITPEIGKLTKLKFIELDNNLILTVPVELGNLENLETLELANNKLSTLPQEIGKLKNLKLFDLEDNNFSESEKTKIKNLLPQTEIEF